MGDKKPSLIKDVNISPICLFHVILSERYAGNWLR